jgi:RND family efflux transporter MFP subunit
MTFAPIRTSLWPLAVACTLLVSCQEEKTPTVDVIRPVKAMEVGSASSMDRAVLTGKAKATQEINVAFEVSGRIIEFPIEVGDTVKEGQELARLDPQNFQNGVDAAAAGRERAEALLGRMTKAFEFKAVSAQAVTDAEAQARASAAVERIAQKQLADTGIKAPFDARVAATYVQNFENILMKQKIVRLIDVSKVEMVVDIPENLIPNVSFVESVKVTFAAFPEIELDASIKEVGSEASELTRTYPVTIIMDQPQNATILPGMAGEVKVTAKLPADRLAQGIPILPSAVVSSSSGEESYVWTIEKESGVVSKTQVTIDRFSPVGVVVTEGLSPGQWIVTAGVHSLNEGQQVRIIEQ